MKGGLRIQLDGMEQTIFLTPRPRRFEGKQWYFVCPVMNRCCSVLVETPRSKSVCQPTSMGTSNVLQKEIFATELVCFICERRHGGGGIARSGGSTANIQSRR